MTTSSIQIPDDVTDYMKEWFRWRSFWNRTHYGLGFSSAFLATLVAANTKSQFLSTWQGVTAAGVAAAFTFLITGLSASARAAAFETAAREVERAIVLVRGGQAEQPTLYDAVARGIDILNRLKGP